MGPDTRAQIKTAEVAYDKPPVYDHFAPGQLRDFASIVAVLNQAPKEAANGAVPLASIPISTPS